MAEESTANSQELGLSEHGHDQGLYAVQFSPSSGSILIPLTYKIPTRTNVVGVAVTQQNGPQRQVNVRRFLLAFRLDLVLILKLVFAVSLFGQDGSRLRMIGLVLLATLIYLYQTGVLTLFIRYAREGLAQPQPAGHQQNVADRQNDVNNHQPDNAIIENLNQPGIENANQQPEQANRINWRVIAKEIQTFVVGFITSLLPGFERHND